MRLSRVIIKNFRRISEADITLAPAAFIIGQNNYGKSTVIRAVELFLSEGKPELEDFRVDEKEKRWTEIQITGYFADISPETASSRGFRGRVLNGEYCLRKTYLAQDRKISTVTECLERPYIIADEFLAAKTGEDLIAAGLDSSRVSESIKDLSKRLSKGWEKDFLDLVAVFDDAALPSWVENPGGISPNVTSKLPKVIHVPALTKEGEVTGEKSGVLLEILNQLFEDLLEGNNNAAAAAEYLNLLEQEMSPHVEGSPIHNLCREINEVIASVFPGCGIYIDTSLQELTAVLKPRYVVNLFSNVKTDITRQGTGLLRTAVFSMLRYRAHLRQSKDSSIRPMLVAFEEPELYLHPSASHLLRDTIYTLGNSDQIICTTHSPWMIDLSHDLQSLVKMVENGDGSVSAINYGISQELQALQNDDRTRVKMLQSFDAELSQVFFTEKTLVVEGDSEQIALYQTLRLLPKEMQCDIKSRFSIVKARGKATIIALVRYLHAVSIFPAIMHDRDRGISGAEVFNPRIQELVKDHDRLIILEECLEDVLGYKEPASDKPYKAFDATSRWMHWGDVPEAWRSAVCRVFGLDEDNIQ